MTKFLNTAFCIGLTIGLPVAALAENHAPTPSDDIAIFATMNVTQENYAAFKAALAPIIDIVRDEEGTLLYDWFRQGDTIYLYERYDNEAAFFAHLENNGPFFGDLFAVAEITSVTTMSPLPDGVNAFLAEFNPTMPELIVGTSY